MQITDIGFGTVDWQAVEPAEVEAIVAQNPTRIDLVAQRLEAVRAFKRLPEAEALAAANKAPVLPSRMIAKRRLWRDCS